ncbi:UNVERIFIED_CONTAM: hypothetical protein H355_003096 [Colinus virginianus]|nr:hypothetical protein H355_003096 [Colinus virginianus]
MEEASLEDEKFVVGCANIILPRDALQIILFSLSEADVSDLPLKHSFAERQGRTMECGRAHKRGRGTETNGMSHVNAVCSEKAHRRTESRAHVQTRGLPCRAGPSPGGRPSPAVNPHSLSKTLAGRKHKDLEEEKQMAEQLPVHKTVRGEHNREMCRSGDSVLAPAAHSGPAPEWISKQRGEKVLWNLPCSAAALSEHTEIA